MNMGTMILQPALITKLLKRGSVALAARLAKLLEAPSENSMKIKAKPEENEEILDHGRQSSEILQDPLGLEVGTSRKSNLQISLKTRWRA